MADDARSIVSDSRAPADEVFDARVELEAERRPTSASDLIPADVLAPIIKAVKSGDLGEDLFKAQAESRVPSGRRSVSQGMRSTRFDTLTSVVNGQYLDKPGSIDFDGLRTMVYNTPVLSAIVSTRIRQMQRFCQPSEDGGPGFEIRHVDKEYEASDGEKDQLKLYSKFMQNGGFEFNPRRRRALGRDTFRAFGAKQMRDSLIMDSAPIETEMRRNRDTGMAGFYHVDGATIRLCTEEGYDGDDKIFAVQVYEGRILTTYTLDQLVYEVRNPRSEINLGGYGMAETEILIRTVTALLNAISYNSDFFDKNSIPKGILNLVGEYGQEDLAVFRREWNALVRGVSNRRSLPILVSSSRDSAASYTPLNDAADEMAFGKWLTFLTSICCAVYNIDPSEIGFESFSASKSSLSGSDTEQKMEHSRDAGFRSHMAHFESVYSDFIVSVFNDDYCFRWVGLEEEDQGRAWEAKKLTATVDEIRAHEGDPPHPNPDIGALPVNPDLIQAALLLQHPQAANGGDFGAGPAPQVGDGNDFGSGSPDGFQEEGSDFGNPEAPEKPEPGDNFGNDNPPMPEGPKRPVAKAKLFGGDDFGLALSKSIERHLGEAEG